LAPSFANNMNGKHAISEPTLKMFPHTSPLKPSLSHHKSKHSLACWVMKESETKSEYAYHSKQRSHEEAQTR
jgi:hypothetical protein